MSIVVWGEGRELENFIFEKETSLLGTQIEYIVSDRDYYFTRRYNRMLESTFLVKKDFLFNSKIIIAASDKEYRSKKRKLESLGYREFDDFIGYRWYGKKLCVINANCYMYFIKRYLNDNSEFRQVYGIYPNPPIHDNSDGCIDDNVLRHTDLFIHQNIRPDNIFGSKFADEYTLNRLKPGCRVISIPNFVGMLDGFYPTVSKKTFENANGETMFFSDWLIDEAYDKYGNNIDNIMYYVASYNFDQTEVLNRFNAMVNKWLEREKNWDLKITDFILENFQTKYLFEDATHPADLLQNEICRRLAALIGVADVNHEKIYQMGCCMELFMWPQIKNILGIKWRKDKIRINTTDFCYHDNQPITIRQYIQEYLWRVYGN